MFSIYLTHSYSRLSTTEELEDLPRASSRFLLTVNSIQIDSQVEKEGVFPVVLMPMRKNAQDDSATMMGSSSPGVPSVFSNHIPMPQPEQSNSNILSVELFASNRVVSAVLENIDIALGSVEVNLEDTLVHRLVEVLDTFVPSTHQFTHDSTEYRNEHVKCFTLSAWFI